MKIIDGFNLIKEKLTKAGAESPAFDASELISYVLNAPYSPLLDNEKELTSKELESLLSFAQRMYDEAAQGQGVEFFSAQRLPDGSRTFKMIQHEPELTSFGLDLYERIVRNS